MILNTDIHEQLAAAQRRDLLEAAERERLVAQARGHDRRRFWSRALRRVAPRPQRIEPALCACAPRTATR
jgi:hypothetical protein